MEAERDAHVGMRRIKIQEKIERGRRRELKERRGRRDYFFFVGDR